ncbi:hypothetical protein D3C83_275050 [compost metagenome]
MGMPFREGEIGAPALDELLDARNVDVAVVQIRLQRRHVTGEEASVLPDRVAT